MKKYEIEKTKIINFYDGTTSKMRRSDMRIIADSYAMIPELMNKRNLALNQLTTSIQETSLVLSKHITEGAVINATALEQISNILENNMLLTEYYSLIQKINECEEYLLKSNKLEDAYKGMETAVSLFEELKFSPNIQYLLFYIFQQNSIFIENLIEICIMNKKAILQYLSEVIASENFKIIYSINSQYAKKDRYTSRYRLIQTKTLDKLISVTGISCKYFTLNFSTSPKLKLKNYQSAANYSFSLTFDTDEVCRFKDKDVEKLLSYEYDDNVVYRNDNFIISDYYLNISPANAQKFFSTFHQETPLSFEENLNFLEFKKLIDCKNFKISLSNLREIYRYLNTYIQKNR